MEKKRVNSLYFYNNLLIYSVEDMELERLIYGESDMARERVIYGETDVPVESV